MCELASYGMAADLPTACDLAVVFNLVFVALRTEHMLHTSWTNILFLQFNFKLLIFNIIIVINIFNLNYYSYLIIININ